MKTLDQIEPRTPISSLPITITVSGSYYVTSNLTGVVNQNGISVSADNVTIDLNGFTLLGGGGGSGEAIWTPTARANIVVRNGTVRNWPGSGVNFYDAGSVQTTVQDIQSISNGFTGIAVKNSSRVKDCVTSGNGLRGIIVDNDTLVQNCKVAGNGVLGIASGQNCRLIDNQVVANGTGLNITGTNNIVSGNVVRFNTNNYGIVLGNQLDLLLCQIPETISWPSKVKLIGPLSVTTGNAITIAANNVTLDLNGFTISSTAPSATGTAILLNSGLKNISIANGFIQGGVTNNGGGVYNGSGFSRGVYYSGTEPGNVAVSKIRVSGCLSDAINLGNSSFFGSKSWTVVESCAVQTSGGNGIVAETVRGSEVRDCGGIGLWGHTMIDSYGESRNSDGIDAVIAQNCYGASLNFGGISSDEAQNCEGISNTGYGVSAGTALNCTGTLQGNGSAALSAQVAMNCIGYSSGSGYAVYAQQIATGCFGSATTGIGLFAFIASGCHGESSSNAGLSVTHNVNSF
jgi:hypothetical protein